jgi:hypothetical protein
METPSASRNDQDTVIGVPQSGKSLEKAHGSRSAVHKGIELTEDTSGVTGIEEGESLHAEGISFRFSMVAAGDCRSALSFSTVGGV